MTRKPEMMLWLNDARGVYIPRDFALSFADRDRDVSGVPPEDWVVLEVGPDHEWYWDVWSSVCESAIVTDRDGVKYTLYQDGDLWLVPEGMEWSDSEDGFVWPEDQEPERDSMGNRIDGFADPAA